MVKNQETEGIILKIFETTNNAYILKVLTEDYSLLTAYAPYAKNSKKRYGQLDLFDWGMFTFKETPQGLISLQEFSARSSFPDIRNSLDKIITVSLLAEILEQITPEGDPSSIPSFKIFKEHLLSLNQTIELKEVLKLTHLCLLDLLTTAGIVENQEIAKPSSHNLIKMITSAEEYLGNRLRLRPEIETLIKKIST